MLGELVGVELDPLGGAEEGGFFAIPPAVNDGALGLPALLEELAEGAGFFELGAGAGDGVAGSVDPGVVVVAADDPLIGHGGALDGGDDVVERLALPVEGELEVGLDGAGAGAIGEGQAAAPGRRGRARL